MNRISDVFTPINQSVSLGMRCPTANGREPWTALPTQIQPLDTRQVGEVTCVIENPHLDLLPGTNVTARILTERVENALTIPKEAIFREGDKPGVYLLVGDHLEWRNITQGINNVTRVEVRDLKEGDMIALPSERTLSAGLKVHPIIRP